MFANLLLPQNSSVLDMNLNYSLLKINIYQNAFIKFKRIINKITNLTIGMALILKDCHKYYIKIVCTAIIQCNVGTKHVARNY